MNSRFIFVIALGALVAAAMSFPFSNESRGGPAFEVAYLDDATTVQVAQQEKPPAPPKPAAGGAPAAPPKPAESKGPGWAVNCKSAATDKGLECRLSQTVVTQQGGLLADVTFRIPADKKNPEAIVRVPLGVLLTAGASVQVDENAPQRLNFSACDRNGCYAQGPISTAMFATLQKGKQVKVSFQNQAKKAIDVPLSLDGFADAYAKI